MASSFVITESDELTLPEPEVHQGMMFALARAASKSTPKFQSEHSEFLKRVGAIDGAYKSITNGLKVHHARDVTQLVQALCDDASANFLVRAE